MYLGQLLAKQADESVCYGPFCSKLQNIPSGSPGKDQIGSLLGSTIGSIINWVIIVAGLLMLLYLLWGALDWIISSGDKEKLEKAQLKITHAVIGLLVVIVALVIFGLVAGDLLGIVVRNPDGTWGLKFSTLAP